MRKKIIIVDAIFLALLVGTVVAVIVALNSGEEEVQYSPQTELFSVPSNIEYVFVDDNLEFSTERAIELENRLVLEFNPGEYFLKFPLEDGKDIRRFTIDSSNVRIMFVLSGTKYRVISVSDEQLEIQVERFGEDQGTLVLDNSQLQPGKVVVVGGGNG